MLEVMLTAGLMVILLGAVGVIFSGVTRTVGSSQALLEVTAEERAVGMLLRRDFGGINKDGFLIIRSRVLDPSRVDSPRYDQVAFLAYGSFASKTGSDDPASPFVSHAVANAAHIWWGQLVMATQDPPDPSYAGRSDGGLPTGVYVTRQPGEPEDSPGVAVVKEGNFVLGRHVTLMVPGPPDETNHVIAGGRRVKAYRNITRTEVNS
ncbi:MAG TPA: hypothetical protein VHM90_13375, partial [Phycisphaerae bacterium]|nr:hypothetical protein [Phycisphaerae bacterium]